MGEERTRPPLTQPASPDPTATSPANADPLLDAAIAAGLAGEVPWWRVSDIVEHLVQVDWLRERGYVPAPPAARAPEVQPPEREARAAAIQAQWAAVSAQIAAGNPPTCEWLTELSEADRQLIRQLHGEAADREAEAC